MKVAALSISLSLSLCVQMPSLSFLTSTSEGGRDWNVSPPVISVPVLCNIGALECVEGFKAWIPRNGTPCLYTCICTCSYMYMCVLHVRRCE